MDKKLVARYIFREILSLVGTGVALFWAAGRLDWWQAWATLGVLTGWLLFTGIVVFHYNPELVVERLERRKREKTWDVAIVSLMGLVTLVRYILAGLDQRYGWTGGFPLPVEIAALILCAAGYALFVWATASNAFFSRLLRIQSERNHTVVTGGPYRWVRHPAYTGTIVYELAVSFLLASWWSLIPSGVGAVMMLVRTALEDRTLQEELDGYKEYAAKVKYRLLPGIW